MIDAAKLLARMNFSLESSKTRTERFAEEFTKNPAWALENSDRTFQDAAIIDIYTRFTNALVANRCTVADIREDVMASIMLGCGRSQSTSPVTNMMQQCRMQTYREVIQWIDGGL